MRKDLLLGAVAFIGAILLVPLVFHVLHFFNFRLLLHTSRRFIADMRVPMSRKLRRLSMRYHSEHELLRYLNRLFLSMAQQSTAIISTQ